MTQMKRLVVYDPAMCCATGVCGPSVDNELVRFAADLAWLAEQGVEVVRYNLAQQPGAFVQSAQISAALTERGEAALPALEIADRVVMSGVYPTREQLGALFGVRATVKSSACCSPKSGCC
jgi:hypothetical protein